MERSFVTGIFASVGILIILGISLLVTGQQVQSPSHEEVPLVSTEEEFELPTPVSLLASNNHVTSTTEQEDGTTAPEQQVDTPSNSTPVAEEPAKTPEVPVSQAEEQPTSQTPETTSQDNGVTTTPSPDIPEQVTITQLNCENTRKSFAMYADPDTQIARIERDMRREDPEKARLLREIACIPHPTWLVGGDLASIEQKVFTTTVNARQTDKIPVFVVYHAPDYNVAEWHALGDDSRYDFVLKTIADAISDRQAWIILEPDALITADRYNDVDQTKRISQLKSAIQILNERAPNARIYLDAGHSNWTPVENAARLIKLVGTEGIDGFSLNVSNYYTTESQIAYAQKLSALTGGLHYVIDTSRNGVGEPHDNEWCNAPNRALGSHPTFATGVVGLDALLWVKPPGESDGFCNGGPQAGTFWLDYALDLVRNRP